MQTKRYKSVAIRYNTLGKPVECIEVKTLDEEQIKALKWEIAENEAKLEQERKLNERIREDELARNQIVAYVLAKQQFNELVESGKVDTTEEFENMYDDFINGGGFNEKIAPQKYKEILGRLTR